MLAATALIVVRLRNLFTVVMLTGIYSLLSATFFTLLDAVDVAFTEAAVGAGVSTVLMLGTLSLVGHQQKKHPKVQVIPLRGWTRRKRSQQVTHETSRRAFGLRKKLFECK
mgnify:CR=1 FL=1